MLEDLSWQIRELGWQIILIIHESCVTLARHRPFGHCRLDIPVPGTASAYLGSRIPNGMMGVYRVLCLKSSRPPSLKCPARSC